jgi:deoxyribonuclease I
LRKFKKSSNKIFILCGFLVAFLATLYGLTGFGEKPKDYKASHAVKQRHLAQNQGFASQTQSDYVQQGSSSSSEFKPHFHSKHPHNFGDAKRLARLIHIDHQQTFYCGCNYDKHNKIDLRSCGYKVQGDIRRAKRLEWEHIVPISQLASHLPCWQKRLCCKNGSCYKGRRCCREIDANFAKMEADLHNLVPEIGELNGLRSNYRFGMLPFVMPGQFGACEFKIDSGTRRVEPRRMTRGTISRVYLYMSKHYNMRLSDSQRQLFEAWNREHPPDAWEVEWDRRIERAQGNSNEYISR